MLGGHNQIPQLFISLLMAQWGPLVLWGPQERERVVKFGCAPSIALKVFASG